MNKNQLNTQPQCVSVCVQETCVNQESHMYLYSRVN